MAARESVRVADCFLLAMDSFMRRHGQGAHITASVLVLERVPDIGHLQRALVRMAEKHPLFSARLHRDWRTWLPYWEIVEPTFASRALPLALWREKGSPGLLGDEACEVLDASAQLEAILAEPLPAGWNARFDLVERRDGSCLAALSWSHLIIDGKGAELLIAEVARLCAGVDEPCDAKEQPRPATDWREKVQRTKPAIFHLEGLAKLPMRVDLRAEAARGTLPLQSRDA